MACPDENALLELIEGRVEGAAGDALDAHLDGCETCRRLVSAFASEGVVPPASIDLPAATLVAGRYQLEGILGTGAMSIVYAAHDRTLDRRIALKLLRDADAADAPDRLRREAQVMARLADPHVLPVHDVGTFEGRVFLTAELVGGGTLADRVAGAGPVPWPVAVELFVQAGRGLAAAHRAGIVHRDFKPSNVLVGEDGRVRVADFGLARRGPAPAPTPGVSSATGSITLTRSDEIVGTPAYMAPELWAGGEADARSDQFAFAVSLHEALNGGHLFDEATIEGYVDKIVSTDAPRGAAKIPLRLERAIHRGLARQRELRFPTMDAFVAELERVRGGASRRRLVIAAIALSAVVGGGAAVATRLGAGGPPCAIAGAALAASWDANARRAVEHAFLASGHPDAAAAFGKVAEAFDAYATRWRQAQVDACEATHVAHVQSTAVLDARTGCLDARRADAVALIGALGGSLDAVGVGRAVSAARGLPRIEDCADVRALGEVVAPPAAAAVEIAAIRAELGRANAEERLGKYKEASAIVTPLVARAEGAAYAPLTASVLFASGRVQGALGDTAGAKATLEQAARAAAAGRDDVLAARIWTHLVEIVAFRMNKRDEGAALIATAEASLLRAGSPPLWVGNLERIRALILRDAAKYPEARAAIEGAIGRFRETLGPDDPLLAGAIHDLAELDRATGRLDEAMAGHTQALEMRRRALGDASPVTAMSHINLGSVYYVRGDKVHAREHYAAGLAIDERSLPPGSPELGNALTTMGAVELADGHLPEARALLERAAKAYAAGLGPDHVRIGMVENNLGEVARQEKKWDEAIAHFERSIAIKEPKLGRRHPEIGATLSNLGDVAVHRGDPEAARRYYLESLSIFEEKVGASGYQVVFPLKGLAQLAIDAHDDRRAVELLRRIIAIREHDKATADDLAPYREELAKAKQRLGR